MAGRLVLRADELVVGMARVTELGAAGLVDHRVEDPEADGAHEDHQETADWNAQQPLALWPLPESRAPSALTLGIAHGALPCSY